MASYSSHWWPLISLLADVPLGQYTDEQAANQNPHAVAWFRERALKELRTRTGQDFGYDANKWRKWLEAHPHAMDPTDEELDALRKEYGL